MQRNIAVLLPLLLTASIGVEIGVSIKTERIEEEYDDESEEINPWYFNTEDCPFLEKWKCICDRANECGACEKHVTKTRTCHAPSENHRCGYLMKENTGRCQADEVKETAELVWSHAQHSNQLANRKSLCSTSPFRNTASHVIAEPLKHLEAKLFPDDCGQQQPPEHSSWPWHVTIVLRNRADQVACAGTLIAPRWVLTSQQCLRPNGTSILQYNVFADGLLLLFASGTASDQKSIQVRRPKSLFLPPNSSNLALLQLDSPVMDLGSACLLSRSKGQLSNRWSMFASVLAESHQCNRLTVAEHRQVHFTQCYMKSFDEHQPCVRKRVDSSSGLPCVHPTGAGLFYKISYGKKEHWILHGVRTSTICSSAKQAACCDKPAAYERVEHQIGWIRLLIGQHC